MHMLNEAGFRYRNSGDEFYTRYSNITRELGNYDFSNMIVYCSCDNPEMSQFVRYFKRNFDALGLKGLKATFLSETPFLYEFDGMNERKIPIRSGRFQDNSSIIQSCDAIVTNPPFGQRMAMEFLNMMLSSGKKFLIALPLHIIGKKEVIDYINSGQLSCGYNSMSDFEGGRSSVEWWTNMEVNKPILPLIKHYDETLYPRYDGRYNNIINCDWVKDIPCDYGGYIGVPISFIRKYNPSQFKILGVIIPRINGKKLMSRLVIKNKNLNESMIIKLTEQDLHSIIKESVNSILNEISRRITKENPLINDLAYNEDKFVGMDYKKFEHILEENGFKPKQMGFDKIGIVSVIFHNENGDSVYVDAEWRKGPGKVTNVGVWFTRRSKIEYNLNIK